MKPATLRPSLLLDGPRGSAEECDEHPAHYEPPPHLFRGLPPSREQTGDDLLVRGRRGQTDMTLTKR